MADNVTAIDNNPLSKMNAGEVSDVCVDMMKDFLERAKSGEIQGVALSYVDNIGVAGYHLGGRLGGFSMQGAAQCICDELSDINRDLQE